MAEDERKLGSHQRVVERMTVAVRGRAWPMMRCRDCGLESDEEAEFRDRPCKPTARSGAGQ